MQCTTFRHLAGQWMEGQRPPEARAHLEDCPACRGLLADLEAVAAAARQWEAEIEPPPTVWTALRARLESEGLIRESAPAAQPAAGGWFADLFAPGPRAALAGAYLAVLLAAGAMLALQGAPQARLAQGPAVQPAAVAAVPLQLNRVERRVARVADRRNPVVASYRESLAIVDNFIALCEKTVREQPDNELAREYLYGAYQQKAELLANMLDRGVLAE